jgi:hypothetical protein
MMADYKTLDAESTLLDTTLADSNKNNKVKSDDVNNALQKATAINTEIKNARTQVANALNNIDDIKLAIRNSMLIFNMFKELQSHRKTIEDVYYTSDKTNNLDQLADMLKKSTDNMRKGVKDENYITDISNLIEYRNKYEEGIKNLDIDYYSQIIIYKDTVDKYINDHLLYYKNLSSKILQLSNDLKKLEDDEARKLRQQKIDLAENGVDAAAKAYNSTIYPAKDATLLTRKLKHELTVTISNADKAKNKARISNTIVDLDDVINLGNDIKTKADNLLIVATDHEVKAIDALSKSEEYELKLIGYKRELVNAIHVETDQAVKDALSADDAFVDNSLVDLKSEIVELKKSYKEATETITYTKRKIKSIAKFLANARAARAAYISPPPPPPPIIPATSFWDIFRIFYKNSVPDDLPQKNENYKLTPHIANPAYFD